ncbi:LacI family DNA-binding transcriptional regulator [Mesorhizobium sp. BAC0120]|uniref:LacI family DNA-binding transcriptional regulator n=1 Tax=Mesorhizobium sp. BAC0120 TaxID=3090670 RepID=UPI00298D246C|nr:LacI family DNA-binding transcriptional regulator [Mesorhizobium sp. BAC0120]MDW6026056.1 LacI family DNA-binding transcriptional regulator [Mesorhizobium sp. BAC0120]
MARRPTISDLARSSGVSVATVDRVLNGRLPVREETARRVYEAAQAIGYHATVAIGQRLQVGLPQYRLGFILQRPDHYFYQSFARELESAVKAAGTFRGTAQVEFLESQTPPEIAAKLRQVGTRCGAVAMVAIDHPTVTSAVAELKEKGVPVFALLSDFAADVRENYLGINNRKAGRTAAWLIARSAAKPGKIAVFVGSHRFHGHEMREIGFRSYFRECAPEFEMIETLVNLEEPRIAYEATLDLLQRSPDLCGLYVAGGGIEGVIDALREEEAAGKLTMVCSTMSPQSREALADDIVTMVIAEPIERLSRELVAQMVQSIEHGPAETSGQTFLPFDIHVSENI